jgi:hypothetical protein
MALIVLLCSSEYQPSNRFGRRRSTERRGERVPIECDCFQLLASSQYFELIGFHLCAVQRDAVMQSRRTGRLPAAARVACLDVAGRRSLPLERRRQCL